MRGKAEQDPRRERGRHNTASRAHKIRPAAPLARERASYPRGDSSSFSRATPLARMSHKFEKRCEARQNEIRDGSVLAHVTKRIAVVCVKFCKKESGMLRNVGKLFGRHRESAYVAGRRCRCEQLPGKVHAAWLLRLIISLRCSFKVSMLR